MPLGNRKQYDSPKSTFYRKLKKIKTQTGPEQHTTCRRSQAPIPVVLGTRSNVQQGFVENQNGCAQLSLPPEPMIVSSQEGVGNDISFPLMQNAGLNQDGINHGNEDDTSTAEATGHQEDDDNDDDRGGFSSPADNQESMDNNGTNRDEIELNSHWMDDSADEEEEEGYSNSSDAETLDEVQLLELPKIPEPDDFTLRFSELLVSHPTVTNECIADILDLFRHVKYERPDIPRGVPALEKDLGTKILKLEYKWCCPKCFSTLSLDFWNNPIKQAKCPCGEVARRNNNNAILFDLRQLLQLILPGVMSKDLSNERGHIKSKFLEEVRDSAELAEGDITLTLNTDGVPLFKSSKCHLYPLLATINELNYKLRVRNVVMLGIWAGTGSPHYPTVFSKMIADLRHLSYTPLSWMDQSGTERKSKVILSFTLCDSIARPPVQNMYQFNGTFGCNICYQSTLGGKTCYFPYTAREPELRTLKKHKEHCKEANKIQKGLLSTTAKNPKPPNVSGVKGYSHLRHAPEFNTLEGFPPDIMHCLYLGVAKQFALSWFTDSSCNMYFSTAKKEQIDKILSQIQVPHFISRAPRSISENLKFYKAHEWRIWLFYFSPIALKDVLTPDYYANWIDLLRGVYPYQLPEITDQHLRESKIYINKFRKNINNLYDYSSNTYNVHLLQHFPLLGEKLGPLFHFTLFTFENFNQELLKYVRGSQFPTSQIIKSYSRKLMFSYHKSRIPNSPKGTMMDIRLLDPLKTNPSSSLITLIRDEGLDIGVYTLYKRISFEGRIYQSSSYTRATKKLSNCFMLKSDDGSRYQFMIVEIYYSCVRDVLCIGRVYTAAQDNALPYLYMSSENRGKYAVRKFDDLQEYCILHRDPVTADITFACFLNEFEYHNN